MFQTVDSLLLRLRLVIIESAGPFTAEETAALICGIFGLEMYNFDPERDMLISISQSEEDEGEEEERERDRVNVIVLPPVYI